MPITRSARPPSGVPAPVHRRHPAAAWESVSIGCSGAEVWRTGGASGLYLKVTPADGVPAAELAAEAAAADWLRGQGVPAAEVLDLDTDGVVAWLVSRALPGRSVAEPWPGHRADAVVDAFADAALRLHGLPVRDCPFDHRLPIALALTGPLAVPFTGTGPGWSPSRLLDELDRMRAGSDLVEPDLAVCHGDLCCPNVLLDPETLDLVGIVDVGALGVDDRHQDLALATRSLADPRNRHLGPAAADRFLARYGTPDPDPRRMSFFHLLDELC